MAKHTAIETNETIYEATTFNCGGCAEYSFFNAGNCNVTIDGTIVIKPRETWKGPSMHPEVAYNSKHRIEFDLTTVPTIKTPVPGQNPPSIIINPGDPSPPIDPRCVAMKSFIK
jgi:hypothetical protein